MAVTNIERFFNHVLKTGFSRRIAILKLFQDSLLQIQTSLSFSFLPTIAPFWDLVSQTPLTVAADEQTRIDDVEEKVREGLQALQAEGLMFSQSDHGGQTSPLASGNIIVLHRLLQWYNGLQRPCLKKLVQWHFRGGGCPR